ncbi:MAG: SDR family oxidoreductase, partial [Gemmatimonadota bacterium]|nr:SDR family oxidoreductase [Gemmatimonadota bacterium]
MNGKSILITGASSGFGRDAAIGLAERGHTVFATMRGVDGKNREVAGELTGLARENDWALHVLELDVTKHASVAEAVRLAVDEAGRIDTLINNAGVGNFGIQEAYTVERAKRLFDVNVFGVLRLNRAVLPHMREAGSGHIVYISSGLGRFVLPFTGIYDGTKWALEALAQAASYELEPLGISTTIIEPGAFGTSFGSNMTPHDDEARAAEYGETLAMFEAFAAGFEEREYGDPVEVKRAIIEVVEAPPEDRPLRRPVGDDVSEPVGLLNETSEKVQAGIME